jgi:hypothetical protein
VGGYAAIDQGRNQMVANRPAATLPKIGEEWGGAKGIYRLLDRPEATLESVTQTHRPKKRKKKQNDSQRMKRWRESEMWIESLAGGRMAQGSQDGLSVGVASIAEHGPHVAVDRRAECRGGVVGAVKTGCTDTARRTRLRIRPVG